MSDFDTLFDRVIGNEGGYTNNPKDPGNWTTGVVGKGELKGTKYGISAMSYPMFDIKNLTLETAKNTYKADFYTKYGIQLLPFPLQYQVFDFGINAGVTRAVKMLQTLVGVKADGYIGKMTVNAVTKFGSLQDLGCCYLDKRSGFYKSLRTYSTFGRGWDNRVATCRKQFAEDLKSYSNKQL